MEIDRILEWIGSLSTYIFVLGLIGMIIALVLKRRLAQRYEEDMMMRIKLSHIERILGDIGNISIEDVHKVETQDDRQNTKK